MAQADQQQQETDDPSFFGSVFMLLIFGIGIALGLDAGAIVSETMGNPWWSLSVAVFFFLYFMIPGFQEVESLGTLMIGIIVGAGILLIPTVRDDFLGSDFYADTGQQVVEWLDFSQRPPDEQFLTQARDLYTQAEHRLEQGQVQSAIDDFSRAAVNASYAGNLDLVEQSLERMEAAQR